MTPTDIDTREGHVSDVDAWHEFKREGMQTVRLHAPPTDDDYKELYQAYSDSSGDYQHGSGKRSLFYYSDALFTADELIKGFSTALAYGDNGRWDYNKFDKYALEAIFDVFGRAGAIYQPARVYSVEVLVHRDLSGVDIETLREVAKAAEADEVTPGVLRILWD